MGSPQFEIVGVKPAPDGAKYLAKIAFAFRPSEMQPVRISRSAEVDGEWRTFTEAEIDGARVVRVRSAFLCRSKNQELYVRCSSVEVPWELSKAIAAEAFRSVEGAQA